MTTIKVRRDTSANWTSINPVLNQGEPGLETDTGRFKFGDGATAWTSLGYASQQLTPTTQTTTYTANPGDLVKANIASASWTMKLPNAPAANTIVGAKVIAQVASGTPNTLTVECSPSGSDVFEQSGGATSVTMSLLSQAAAWQYNSGYWTRISDDLPLGQLDSRYGMPVYSARAYGATGNGATDDTAALVAMITAATGSAAPASNIRVPTGTLVIPAGTYKISADLNFLSVQGLQFMCDGAEQVIFKCTGHAFTNAAIYINGADSCVFGGFTVVGDGTEGTAGTGAGGGIPNAVWLTWDGGTAAQRSTTQNVLKNIRVRNLRCFNGVNLSPTGGAYQVDGTLCEDITVSGGQFPTWSSSGYYQNGFQIGSGYFGNAYNQVLVNCHAVGWYYGYYCDISGYELYGAEPGFNYCDFYYNYPNAQCTVSGVQSQDSQMAIQGTAGAAGSKPVSFRDFYWASQLTTQPPGNEIITVSGDSTSPWEFSSCHFLTGISTYYAPVISFASTYGANGMVATFINCSMQNTPALGFSITSTRTTVVLVNFAELTSSGEAPTASWPLYIYSGGSWSAPSAPPLVTVGEIAISGTTSMTSGDYALMHACTVSSAYTVTLPTPSGVAGTQIGVRIVDSSTNLLTLATAAGTIDGASTRIMWAGESAILESDGAKWVKIGGKTLPMTGMMTITSSDISVSSGSVTNLPLTQTLLDNSGLMCSTSNTYITAQRGSNYLVVARVAWAAMPAASNRTITVAYVSGGSNVAAQDERYSVASPAQPCIGATGEIALTAGQYVTLSAYQTTGSAATANYCTAASPGNGTILSLTEIPAW